ATLGLLSRPLLFTCAIASLWGMAAFFELVYAGGYRHEGIWLLFLISLYWMRLSEADAQQFSKTTWRFEMVPLYGVLSLILTMNCMFGARLLWNDYTKGMSNSNAVGAIIRSDLRLHDAIILPEPGPIGDTIPYYGPNDMYYVRDRRFGRYSAAPTYNTQRRLSLTELLDAARSLKVRTGRPALIVLEWDLADICPADVCTTANFWEFSYTPDERQKFFDNTQRLPVKRVGVLESMDAYLLK